MKKVCPTCKKEKPISEFYENYRCLDNLSHQCKECQKQYGKKRYQKNREKIKENAIKYYKKNKEQKKNIRGNIIRNGGRITQKNIERIAENTMESGKKITQRK